jgi:hypothetical protein
MWASVIEKQLFGLKSQVSAQRTEHITPIGLGFGISRLEGPLLSNVVRTISSISTKVAALPWLFGNHAAYSNNVTV